MRIFYIFLTLHLTIFIIFFIINFILMIKHRECWKGLPEENWGTILDSFYYTTATHTSIGFGDITPKSRMIRVISSIHMIIVFILIIVNIDIKNI